MSNEGGRAEVALEFEDRLGGFFAEREARVAEVAVEGGLATFGVHTGENFPELENRRGFGLRAVLGDLHGLLGHFQFLIGVGFRLADRSGHLVLRGVDGGEGFVDVARWIDVDDERGVEIDPVAGGGLTARVFHKTVNQGQITAEVVDGNALDGALSGFAVKGGDAITQDRDEVADDVGGGVRDTEEVGVEIALAGAPTDLAGDLDSEVILGDGLDRVLANLRVSGDIDRLNGHIHFVETLPRPLEIRAAGWDDADVGIAVPGFFLIGEERTEGGISVGGAVGALGATKRGEHAALRGADRVNAEEQREERGDADAEDEAEQGGGDHGSGGEPGERGRRTNDQ